MAPIDFENSYRSNQSSNSTSKEAKGLKKFFGGALTKFKQIFNKKKKCFSKYKYDTFNLNQVSRAHDYQNLNEQGDSRSTALENVKIIIQFDKINEIVGII